MRQLPPSTPEWCSSCGGPLSGDSELCVSCAAKREEVRGELVGDAQILRSANMLPYDTVAVFTTVRAEIQRSAVLAERTRLADERWLRHILNNLPPILPNAD